MRELKFRAWAGGVMVYFDLWDVRRVYGGLRRTKAPQLFVSRNNETIMQFTGLHDKNGKEVY